MSSARQIAHYILTQMGEMSAMKLQKLVFYSQAWSLVWDDKPLFDDCIEAWANGPVVPNVYSVHRGKFKVSAADFQVSKYTLSDGETETIQIVLKELGDKSAQWLSDLTHSEHPWLDARKGMSSGERGNTEISHAAMHEYYISV
jgi:uncharacterized phage-associated protein